MYLLLMSYFFFSYYFSKGEQTSWELSGATCAAPKEVVVTLPPLVEIEAPAVSTPFLPNP